MTKKIVFLDVDGTLCDDAGNVPESARQAITAAHKKGHEFFLCTGRSKAEITEDVLALPLSGMIGACSSCFNLLNFLGNSYVG